MANEKRLIYSDDLVKTIVNTPSEVANMYTYNVLNSLVDRTNEILNLIDKAPAVDAVEVVHGEWSTIEDDYCGMIALQCSECNQEYWFEDEPPIEKYHYCPNCGAKMDGGKADAADKP